MKTKTGKPIPRIMPTSDGNINGSKKEPVTLKMTFIKVFGKEIY